MTDGIIQEAFNKYTIYFSSIDKQEYYQLQQELIEKIKQEAHAEHKPHLDQDGRTIASLIPIGMVVSLEKLIGDNK